MEVAYRFSLAALMVVDAFARDGRRWVILRRRFVVVRVW